MAMKMRMKKGDDDLKKMMKVRIMLMKMMKMTASTICSKNTE